MKIRDVLIYSHFVPSDIKSIMEKKKKIKKENCDFTLSKIITAELYNNNINLLTKN